MRTIKTYSTIDYRTFGEDSTVISNEYKDVRFEHILNAEGLGVTGHPGKLYYDSRGILTNGVGFNLTIGAIRETVIASMGIDISDTADPIEVDFRDRINTALVNGGSGSLGFASTLQAQVNAIMQERKAFL